MLCLMGLLPDGIPARSEDSEGTVLGRIHIAVSRSKLLITDHGRNLEEGYHRFSEQIFPCNTADGKVHSQITTSSSRICSIKQVYYSGVY